MWLDYASLVIISWICAVLFRCVLRTPLYITVGRSSASRRWGVYHDDPRRIREIIKPFAGFRCRVRSYSTSAHRERSLDGIVTSISRSRNRETCTVTYRRVRQHVRSTPYFMARATDRVSAACYQRCCRCWCRCAVTAIAGCMPPHWDTWYTDP